jgi:cobalt-zinc-cadmium resistance protein CzcA
MIAGLIRAALTQRVLVAVVALMFVIAGLQATRKLAIDAFPDVTNIQVQIATDAPGRSPEEVERFITAPIEIGMTGIPGLTEMRSLNKPGLSPGQKIVIDGAFHLKNERIRNAQS